MLKGLLRIVEQAAAGEARVENVYSAAVTEGGNTAAVRLLNQVFEPGEATWRAMGPIPGSGLIFREEYRSFDALYRFGLEIGEDYDPPGCRCGEVIQGRVDPAECPLFAERCTPTDPVGPCMVSGEGTCAAAFKYGHRGMPLAGCRGEQR